MKLGDIFRWLYNASKGIRVSLFLTTLWGLLCVASSMMFIWFSKRLIDIATGQLPDKSLGLYICLFISTLLFQRLFVVLKGRIEGRTSTTLMNRLRGELFTIVMRSEWSGKEKFHTGDVVNRIESDSRTIGETLCITIPAIVVTGVRFIISFQFLHFLDSRLAWLIVVIMPISLLLSKRFLLTMRTLTQNIRTTDSDIQAHMQEQIQHRTLISTLGNIELSKKALGEKSAKLLKQTMRSVNYTLYSRTMVQIGFAAGYIIAFIWGINGLSSGAVSFGVMTAFLQLVAQIQNPSVEIATQISTTAKCSASVERLKEIYDMQVESQEQKRILEGAVGLKIDNVTFGYADGGERKILKNFNYDFIPNSLHVIVGHTGVGKSTLIRLMLGLLKVNEGAIKLYNSAEDVDCGASTRGNFVYVPQGNTLMSGTVRENLLLAKPTASDEELREVLHIAVADFVYQMPMGLDSICGERGAGLSEGEAQRIAIARGLLQSGGVMLLDEPTSALDSKTEETLINRLGEYAKNRTLIMVTHRDTAAQLCASVVKLG